MFSYNRNAPHASIAHRSATAHNAEHPPCCNRRVRGGRGLSHVTVEVQPSRAVTCVIAVKSPCIDVCAFNGKTQLCVGCFQTLDEIRGWNKMTDHRRHQVINRRTRRQAKVQHEPLGLPGEPLGLLGEPSFAAV